MINLRATRIYQSFSLADGSVQNYLVVELPDGTELKAPIDEGQTEQIIGASLNGEEHEQAAVQAHDNFTGAPAQEYEQASSPVQRVGEESDEQDTANAQELFEHLNEEPPDEGELVNWGMLPNSVLTVTMKAAFKMLGAPAQLTYNDIQELATNVAEQFGPEDWAKVQQQVSRPPPQTQAQQAKPIGQVQWADGSPMVPGAVPTRTVPKTDMGYPVTEGEVDPGEVVAGGETDEDGVGQL